MKTKRNSGNKPLFRKIAALFSDFYYHAQLYVAKEQAIAHHMRTGEAVFVIPDENERLKVITEQNLKMRLSNGDVEYVNTYKSKVFKRKKEGRITKQRRKRIVIGRKAYTTMRMRLGVTYKDLMRESFFMTGGTVEKTKRIPDPTPELLAYKRKGWIAYRREMKRRKDEQNGNS